MSEHDDGVPDWAPRRTPPGSGGPGGFGPFTRPSPGPSARPGPGGASPGPGGASPGPGGVPSAPRGAASDGANAGRPPGGPVTPDHPADPPRDAAGPGRARSRRRAGPPRRFGGVLSVPLAGAVALALLAGAGVYWLASGDDACSGEDALTIGVAAAPDIVPAVRKAARRFNDARHEIAGRCAHARVRSADPAAVAASLSGGGSSGAAERPDVWIPDSSLWTKLVQSSGGAGAAVGVTHLGGIASTPIVAVMPAGPAAQLRALGAPAHPSWKELFAAAGRADDAERGTGGAPAAGDAQAWPFLLTLPDPGRTATGMGVLMLAGALPPHAQEGRAGFAGTARALRESVAPSVEAQFAAFGREAGGRYPVAVAPEQAVFARNAQGRAEPAVAVYPAEGTVYLDHPVAVLSGEPAELDAARRLHRELTSAATREHVLRLGFRAPDGTAPAAFSAGNGLAAEAPEALPDVPAGEVGRTMRRWAQLALGIRMLSVIDVSESMNEQIAPGVTRLQAALRTVRNGLPQLPADTEAGQWVFSGELEGGKDWRELVSVGPLDERLGSDTRRRLLLSTFSRTKVEGNGGAGLYGTTIAAFDHMRRTHKPEYINTVLLWTGGRNDDRDGPSLEQTLDHIRRTYDPERPVVVNMLGIGDGVDAGALRRIARLTNGEAYVAETPDQVQAAFFKALSQEVCGSDC